MNEPTAPDPGSGIDADRETRSGAPERPARSRFAFLDAAWVSAVIFDLDARPVHRTPAFGNLGLTDAEEQELTLAARALARSLAAVPDEGAVAAIREPLRVTRPLRLGRRTFRLDGDRLHSTGDSGGPVVLVTIREVVNPRHGGEGFGIPAVRDRFGLTPREVEVANLLARRLTNREVAGALGISQHTARHHTQRILTKLDIHSRRQVEQVLKDVLRSR